LAFYAAVASSLRNILENLRLDSETAGIYLAKSFELNFLKDMAITL